MSSLVTQYAEVAFVLLVTGAAMFYPPLALGVAGLYFVVLAVLHDRRSTPPNEETAE